MTWIRSVVAYGLSEYDPGVVAVPRGAGSIGWSVDSRFAPLNRLPYPGETPFRRPFDALGWQIVRFLQIVTKKRHFQWVYLQKTHNG